MEEQEKAQNDNKQQRKIKDYSQGKIYKITNDVDSEIYVGRTCKKYLSQRMTAHRSGYSSFLNGKNHMGMKIYHHFQKIGIEHFHIELLEKCENCTTIDYLSSREAFWIKELKSSLNTNMPGRTYHIWYVENKENYIIKCECGGTYARHHEARHTKSLIHINRMESIKTGIPMNPQKSLSFDCQCGEKYTENHKARHKRTQKHQSYVSSLTSQ